MSKSGESSTDSWDFGAMFGIPQIDFDQHFFGRILAIHGDNVDVLLCQSDILITKGEYLEANRLLAKLTWLCPDHAIVFYNYACTSSVIGKISDALAAFEQAISLGYDDWARIEADSDLDNLRLLPEFEELISAHSGESHSI